MGKKIKIFVILILILAVAAGAYFFLSSKTNAPIASSTKSGLVAFSGAAPASSSGQVDTKNIDQFSSLLSTIESITIDTTIFQNKAYVSLRDNPIEVGTDIVGRSNPFAPIGADSTGAAPTAAQVTTLQPGKITSTSAELTSQVTLSDTTPATAIFEYGISDAFGSTTAPTSLSHTGTAIATLTGLSPNTLYYVRADAVKGGITTTGNTVTFTTQTPTKR